MTAITTNKTWFKFIVVLFLIAVGIAGGYYAYIRYFNTPAQEELIDEEAAPAAEPATGQKEII